MVVRAPIPTRGAHKRPKTDVSVLIQHTDTNPAFEPPCPFSGTWHPTSSEV